MQITFSEAPTGRADLRWGVSSRGTDVRVSRPMCTIAASRFAADASARARADAHRSRPVTVEDIDDHALIIAASEAERTAIARLRPAARPRVFTLLEALMLGTDVRPPADAPDQALRAAAPVTEFAAYLNARRGLVTAAEPRVGGRRVRTLDIPDAHHRGIFAHRAMLKDVRSSVLMLAGLLAEFGRA